jgi:hypothetical protein
MKTTAEQCKKVVWGENSPLSQCHKRIAALESDLADEIKRREGAEAKIGSAFWLGHTMGRLWGGKAISREEIERGSREIALMRTQITGGNATGE